MNYIKHLNSFWEIADADSRLSPFHLSIYNALFRCWNLNYFKNPVSINRDEVMKMAKIGSVTTYIKCIKELHEWQYIYYEPSYNRYKGSLIHLYTFENGSVHLDGIDVVRSINYINNTNKKKQEIESAQAQISNSILSNMKTQELTPENATSKNRISEVPPPLSHVKIYFSEKNFSDQEAEKFFNYFESTGWLVGGRTKMRDWKAAARNWMLNIPKFAKNQKPTSPDPIRLNPNKRYDEPL